MPALLDLPLLLPSLNHHHLSNGSRHRPLDMTRVAVQPSLPCHYDGPAPQMASNTLNTTNILQGTRQQKAPSLTSQLGQPSSNANWNPKPGTSIASYLQIPASINQSKGSLAEFAAQVTCLFWFTKASTVKLVEDGASSYLATPTLEPESVPSIGFRKWLTTVLSTTQVSQNVVLLALLFIYRLKKFNPAVRGKRGSEFRLMTIALMMGNKFLDDNTYTNSTWAEVSGISVKEIHVMEVEFLSNVRYNLFVTNKEWGTWQSKLAVFANYFEKTSRLVSGSSETLSPTSTTSNALSGHPAKSLSPLSTQYAHNNNNNNNNNIPPVEVPTMRLPSVPATLISQPTVEPPVVTSQRKRSWDEDTTDYPSKKQANIGNRWMPHAQTVTPPRLPPYSIPQVHQPSAPAPTARVGIAAATTAAPPATRLPKPNFTDLTSPQPFNFGPTAVPQSAPITQPLASGAYNQPVASTPLTSYPTSQPLPLNVPQNPHPHPPYSDMSRRQAPYPLSTSTTISPALSAYSVHTPTRLSPSSILLDRNSPYRPVRAVNTLLYPPPSGSLLQPRQLSVDLMRYQPLGKRTEDRTGVLPYSQPQGWMDRRIPQPQFNPTQPPSRLAG